MCASVVLVVGYKRLGAELNGELVAPICSVVTENGRCPLSTKNRHTLNDLF